MTQSSRFGAVGVTLVVTVECLMASSASAAFTTFTSFGAWQATTPSYSTIDFGGFPQYTVLTDQYAEAGLTISSDSVAVVLFGAPFQLDGIGLHTEGSWIDFNFTTPQRSFSVLGLGLWKLEFFLGETLIGSTPYSFPNLPNMTFGGAMSDTPFDRVRIKDFIGESVLDLDNIYFSTVPAPAGVLVLVLGVALRRRRRG